MDLNPEGEPPSRSARWCPSCRVWIVFQCGRRRCAACGTAVVRPAKPEKLKPGELRPGIIAEFDDPRDRYDPRGELAAMRARLKKPAAAVMLALAIASASCASMPTKQRRARDAAELGLVSHPELGPLQQSIDRLAALVEQLQQQVVALIEGRAADREGERDDMEKVMEFVRGVVDELKMELARRR